MQLPQSIRIKIENLLSASGPTKQIQKNFNQLKTIYRLNRNQIDQAIESEQRALAYVSSRMPATYASLFKVLGQLKASDINSILDVGAGPGTAALAATEIWPQIDLIQLIESNPHMLSIGKKLFEAQEKTQLSWIHQDFNQLKTDALGKFDLVILGYSFNECPKHLQIQLFQKYWELTNQFLVIVEPGSKDCFESLNTIRQFCIQQEIKILAPCTHIQSCPAIQNKDWCHFPARVERSKVHREIKQSTKNYEDEKFSYLILEKKVAKSSDNNFARLLEDPLKKSGHLILNLCCSDGLVQKLYSKNKNKLNYPKAKKLNAGDLWQLEEKFT